MARHARPASRWPHLGGFAAGLMLAGRDAELQFLADNWLAEYDVNQNAAA